MFLVLDPTAHSQSPKATGVACTSSSTASESYPVSILRPALSSPLIAGNVRHSLARLALGREDSS